MGGIPSVNVVVLERLTIMISKEDLQVLKDLNHPYHKRVWEYAEYQSPENPLKYYLRYMRLYVFKRMTWEDSYGLEELNYGN